MDRLTYISTCGTLGLKSIGELDESEDIQDIFVCVKGQ